MKRFLGLAGITGLLVSLGIVAVMAATYSGKFTNPNQILQKYLGPLGTVTVTRDGAPVSATIQGTPNGSISLGAIMYSDSGATYTAAIIDCQNPNIATSWSATGTTPLGTFSLTVGTGTIFYIPNVDEATYVVQFTATQSYTVFGIPPNEHILPATRTSVSTATVIISVPKPTTAAISPSTATITVDGSQTLYLSVWDQIHNIMPDFRGTPSCNPLAAGSVGGDGTYTAFVPYGTWTGIMTVTFQVKGTLTAIATITVVHGTRVQNTIVPETATVNLEGSQPFVAYSSDSRGNTWTDTYAWWLSDAIGSISATGSSANFVATKSGICNIFASSTDGIEASGTITVVIPAWSFNVPSVGTACVGFFASVRMWGYNGVATITSLGTSNPGSITIVNSRWDGYVTVTTTGTWTLIATGPNGSVTSNPIYIKPGLPKGVAARNIPRVVNTGYPLQGTDTEFIIVDDGNNETELPNNGFLSFAIYPSSDGGTTWGAALNSISENIKYYSQAGHELPLAAGTSRVTLSGVDIVTKVSNNWIADSANTVFALGYTLKY